MEEMGRPTTDSKLQRKLKQAVYSSGIELMTVTVVGLET